jgi:hypothetical protein
MMTWNGGLYPAVFALILVQAISVVSANEAGETQSPGAAGGISSLPTSANPDAFLTGSGGMVSDFTGVPAFSVDLGSLSGNNGLHYELNLQYFGGVQSHDERNVMFSSPSWVGEGFSMGWPQIFADMKGTANLADDDYFLSLDGQPIKMIGVEGSPDRFVLKNNRFINITRTTSTTPAGSYATATDPWGTILSSPPAGPVSFPVTTITSWTIKLPDGKTLSFPFSGNCDTDNGVMCTPLIGDKAGYQPFYNLSAGARVPDQWNIGSITDLDQKFLMAFEYETKPSDVVLGVEYLGTGAPARSQMKADRAVWLKRVLSYNGIGEGKELTGEVEFGRMDKPGAPNGSSEYFGWPAHDPLIRYDRKCLQQITVKNRGKTARTLNFYYGHTGNNKLRLESIWATEPVQGKVRPLKQFHYDATDGWKLVKVREGNGMETDFEWGNVKLPSGNTITQPEWIGWTRGKVGLKLEYGNNLFLSMDNVGNSCANGIQEHLFQYTNNGVNWELTRIYHSPVEGCGGQWFIAPDASYIGYIQEGGPGMKMRIYELPMKGVDSRSVDLRNDPAQHNPQVFSMASNNGKARVFPFKHWMAVHYENSANVSFFHRTPAGIWRDGTHDAAGAAIPCIVQHEASGTQPQTTTSGCITYNILSFNQGKVDVRGGDDMIAVLQRVTDAGPNVMRIYGYNNGIKEYTKGLMKSAKQKNVVQKYTMPPSYTQDLQDWWNEWAKKVRDFSVSGRFVVVHADRHDGGADQNIFVFAWDGNQLRFLHQETGGHINDQIYAGPDYFVRKSHTSTSSDGTGNWHYYKVDLTAWKVYKSPALYSAQQTGLKYWTCKPMAGYFLLEKMSNPGKAYETATAYRFSEVNYPHLSGNGLFVINGNNGEVATEINPSIWPGLKLGNINMVGDKMMGLRIPSANTGYDAGYFYGTLRASPLGAPNWDVRHVGFPTGWDYISGYPISSGAAILSMAKYESESYWTGNITFTPENKTWYTDPSDLARSTAVITKVHMRSKGFSSKYEDGSLKTVAFTDIAPAGSYYNGMMRVANYSSVTKKFEWPFASVGSDIITTEYLMDKVSADGTPQLPENKKSLHGSPVTTSTNAGLPNTVGSKKTSTFGSITYTTTPDNLTLKEKVYLPWAHTTTSQDNFKTAYNASDVKTTYLDPLTGAARISVSKQGWKYAVTLTRFEHEFTNQPPYDLVRQTASYLFNSDPCNYYTSNDPCGNLTVAWFSDPTRQKNAVGSTINKYAENRFKSETWEWRPATLGVTPLTTLDGNTSSGTWVKTGSILQRNREVPAARAKDISPTIVEKGGVYSTTFYGGPEAYKLGTVINADRNLCALLSGEEESVTPGMFGSFGEWQPAGSVISTEMPHTGSRSIKVTQVYGPSVNIYYRAVAGDAFWSRKKGFKVSGWIYVKGTNNGGTSDPFPGFVIELRPAAGGPLKIIELVGEYPKANLPYNRWVKLERLVTHTDLKAFTPDAGAYLRIWAGKLNSANTAPVYVDDIRIHPSDASVLTTQNFDDLGTMTSALDENNDPVFFQYNVWGTLIGTKDKNGMAHASKGSKRFNE